MVTVRPARPEDAQACVDVLASSPDFFTRETHDEARTGVANSRPGGERRGRRGERPSRDGKPPG